MPSHGFPKPSTCHGRAKPFAWIVPSNLQLNHLADGVPPEERFRQGDGDRELSPLPMSLSWEAVGTGSEPRPGLPSARAVGRLHQAEDLQLRSPRLCANPGDFAFVPALLWPEPRARCQARSWSIRSLQRAPRHASPTGPGPVSGLRDLPTETRPGGAGPQPVCLVPRAPGSRARVTRWGRPPGTPTLPTPELKEQQKQRGQGPHSAVS